MARFSSEKPAPVASNNLNYCRFCGIEKDSAELFNFGRSYNCLSKYIKRLRFMKIYINLQNNLPTFICSICFVEFNRYYDFIKQLNDAQENLRIIFTNNNNIVQAEPAAAAKLKMGECNATQATNRDLPLQIRNVDDKQTEKEGKNEVSGKNNEGLREEGYKEQSNEENDGGHRYDSHVEGYENKSSEEDGGVTHKEDEETDEEVSDGDGDSPENEKEKEDSLQEKAGDDKQGGGHEDVEVFNGDGDHKKDAISKSEENEDSLRDEDDGYGDNEVSATDNHKKSDSSESEENENSVRDEEIGSHADEDSVKSDSPKSEENDQETAEEEGQQDNSNIKKNTEKDSNNSSNDTPDRPEPITDYQIGENEVTENQPSTSRLITKRRGEETQDEPPSQRSKLEEERNKSWSSYTWTCCHCDNQYTTLRELRIHTKEVHRICFGFECPECDAEHYRFEAFVDHVRGHWNNLRYYCPICDKRFKRISQCNAHYDTHPKRSACRYCGEILPSSTVVALHHSIYGRRILQIEMDYVPMVIAVTEETGQHFTFENFNYSWKEYRWTCRLCGVVFRNMQALRDHGLAVHRNCFTVKCRDCNEVSTNFLAFIVHVSMHRTDLKMSCPYCDMCVVSTFLLGQHLHSHLGYPINACATCGQTFQNDIEKAHHYRNNEVVEQPTNFPSYNNEADVLGNYNQELQLVEEDDSEYEFKCSSCELYCPSEESLIEHNQPVKCDFCELIYDCFFKLRQHMFAAHFAHKPFQCLKCGRCFRYRKSSINHIKTHENEDLETCRVCREKVTKKFFKQHIKLHDPRVLNVWESFRCKTCKLRLPSFSDLVRHVQRAHEKIMFKEKIVIADYIKSAPYLRQQALMERETQ